MADVEEGQGEAEVGAIGTSSTISPDLTQCSTLMVQKLFETLAGGRPDHVTGAAPQTAFDRAKYNR